MYDIYKRFLWHFCSSSSSSALLHRDAPPKLPQCNKCPAHSQNTAKTAHKLPAVSKKTGKVCFYILKQSDRSSPETTSPWLPLRLPLPPPPLSLRVLTWTALSCHAEISLRLFTEPLGRASDCSTPRSTSLAFHNKSLLN